MAHARWNVVQLSTMQAYLEVIFVHRDGQLRGVGEVCGDGRDPVGHETHGQAVGRKAESRDGTFAASHQRLVPTHFLGYFLELRRLTEIDVLEGVTCEQGREVE